ncbi:YbaK/EbsC family protein [Dolosigranulum pigrum]|uniref:YbaK/EbsC family protein n=1 Tax=Dolosigranulum pigrum TaxID=29394 RepID=UPI001AD861E3|nr:YbaK/EbsC family protein [Dolosigranulum pigrum]QTJ56419.1 prolyl-tRNA synthetase associated domain-containing protein [Dolosigranulum pigrum]
MDSYQLVEDELNALNIEFQLIEHEPALTIEQADQFMEGIPGVRTKTMFLTDKKKRRFYLVIMDDAQRLDMDRFQEITGESKIKLGSEDAVDKDRMSFHPNTNEKTIFINTPDLLTFLDHLGYTPHIVEL